MWFTEFEGSRHWVEYGTQLKQHVIAKTTKLSRVREDQDSKLKKPVTQPTARQIWRHEATVKGLTPNHHLPYRVKSISGNQTIGSKVFTLASSPTRDQPLKVLLTSDHQLMPMTAANLSKVAETEKELDAVFLSGDLVNIPDRASEWFDDSRGWAFFPALQGKGHYELERGGIKTIYRGGEIIQHAPLFTALGNHEVMGQKLQPTLKQEFNNPIPRQVATQAYYKVENQVIPILENKATNKREFL